MNDIYNKFKFVKLTVQKENLKKVKTTHLKPIMGYSLQIEHLASWRAVSAAAKRCNTGSQTIDCGSSLSQSKKFLKVIVSVFLAF